MNYYECRFEIDPLLPAREVLIAELAEKGFESFVETENGLMAYIQEPDYNDDLLRDLDVMQWPDQQVRCSSVLIPDENWNAEWEKNFEPIEVDDRCYVRAPFHSARHDFPFEIVIEPRMSFGTGHHATTWLVLREMTDMDMKGKEVLDMGSGTGVLAILAEKMGAGLIDAIDIDDWAYENAIENIQRNQCTRITCKKGDANLLGERIYSVILANINRNILTRDAAAYERVLETGGDILLSGFYTADIPIVANAFKHCKEVSRRERNGWALLHLRRN